MAPAPARSIAERVRHALARLATDVDLWVATASADGVPYLVPLSYLWHEGRILLATSEHSATVRNLRNHGRVRLSLDGTRDVVLVDGDAELVPGEAIAGYVADAYAAHAGWDPRTDPETAWIVVTPTRVRAWREVNELPGREIMRDGAWADAEA
jgi:nitroimidazol reductase NimA-like FMN-containing flavoprotein (pyridoxamine 5'-phosphate oxidase superfamily)